MVLSCFAYRKPKRTIAASVLAGELVAALIFPVGTASAFCDSVDCVPNVARNIAPTLPCTAQRLYDFGVDSGGKTYVCDTAGFWIPVGPLVGIREVALPCDAIDQSAQGADGTPLRCAQVNVTLRWIHRLDTPG